MAKLCSCVGHQASPEPTALRAPESLPSRTAEHQAPQDMPLSVGVSLLHCPMKPTSDMTSSLAITKPSEVSRYAARNHCVLVVMSSENASPSHVISTPVYKCLLRPRLVEASL